MAVVSPCSVSRTVSGAKPGSPLLRTTARSAAACSSSTRRQACRHLRSHWRPLRPPISVPCLTVKAGPHFRSSSPPFARTTWRHGPVADAGVGTPGGRRGQQSCVAHAPSGLGHPGMVGARAGLASPGTPGRRTAWPGCSNTNALCSTSHVAPRTRWRVSWARPSS